jgi:bifunctional non-homologous end joining protein LigD
LLASLQTARYCLTQFIVPVQPKLRASPPTADSWIHEIKWDGWRVQVHKYFDTVTLYTRGGHFCGRRVPSLVDTVAQLPIRSFIIDGEVTACNDRGIPDFRKLHFRNDRGEALCIWASDLLYLDGKDLRPRSFPIAKGALSGSCSKWAAAGLPLLSPSLTA